MVDFAGDTIGALPIGGHDAPELLELLSRPAWMRDALCREPAYNRRLWFPELGEGPGPARDVCRRCLVVDECLDYALTHGERGIWGGTSELERRKMRRGAA